MQAYTSPSQNRASLRSIASPNTKKPSTKQKTWSINILDREKQFAMIWFCAGYSIIVRGDMP